MKNIKDIAYRLFSKIRSKFSPLTIGDKNGNVVLDPHEAVFFEFKFPGSNKGKVTLRLDTSNQESLVVMFRREDIEDDTSNYEWNNFLKGLSLFAKKNFLNFEVRNIKKGITRRDYERQTSQMKESKLYGNKKYSYQNVGEATLVLKHLSPIHDNKRSKNIHSIFIENSQGERFKYPYLYLTGARAMARHVSEGGSPYDKFGEYIISINEELYKFRKLKSHLAKDSIMAENLKNYQGLINERMIDIKKELNSLQKESFYYKTKESYREPIVEDIPEDIKNEWIDELTIKSFNEELEKAFPYLFRLVSEKKYIGPKQIDDFLNENIRSNKNYKHEEYKTYEISVSLQPVVPNKHMAYAYRNNKEITALRSNGSSFEEAMRNIKEKIDSLEIKNEKLNTNTTANLNVAFLNEIIYRFFNKKIQIGDKIYAKIIEGPKLVIPNHNSIIYLSEILEKEGFIPVQPKKSGYVFQIRKSIVKSLDLISHGRYLLEDPKVDEEGNLVYNMKYHSTVDNPRDIYRFTEPAIGVNPSRTSTIESLVEYEKKKGVDGKACWKGYRYAGTKNNKDKCVKVRRKK